MYTLRMRVKYSVKWLLSQNGMEVFQSFHYDSRQQKLARLTSHVPQ